MEAGEAPQGSKRGSLAGSLICDCPSRKIIIAGPKRRWTYVPIFNQAHLSATKGSEVEEGDCLEYLVKA